MAVVPTTDAPSDRPAFTGRAVALGALLIVMVMSAVIAHDRAPALVGMTRDDGEYLAFAWSLVHGDGYRDPVGGLGMPARRFPAGFPLLLAALWPSDASAAQAVGRLSWVGPSALALYAGLAALAVRRWGQTGWPVAVAVAAVITLHPQVLQLASLTLSDVPFAVLALSGLLAADMARGLSASGAAGVLLGAAMLTRYAGIAMILGALVRPPRRAAALLAGVACVILPWLCYRSGLGGEAYAGEVTGIASQVLAPEPLLTAVWHVIANGVGGFILPLAYNADPGPLGVLAFTAAGVAFLGAASWLRAREAPAFALLATLLLTAAWTVAYVYTERALATRLLMPVAPLVWVAFLRGVAHLAAREPALQARAHQAPWLLALPVAAVLVSVALGPGTTPARHAEVARDHMALMQAIRAHVPTTEVVMAPLPAVVWIYSDRHAITYPSVLRQGRAGAPSPVDLEVSLAAASWLVATPPLWSSLDLTAETVLPYMQAYPQGLKLVWQNARGDYALFAVRR